MEKVVVIKWPFKKSKSNRGRNEDARMNRRTRNSDDSALSSSGKFTRNKTLTSYYQGSNTGGNHEIEKSERQRVHRVKARQKQVVTLLTVLVGLIFFVGLMIFNFTSNVTTSAVSDQSNIVNEPDQTVYETTIAEYLGGHPTSRFRFALNLKDLSAYVSDKRPEVKYIKSTSFNGIGTSNFDIVFRQPILKWEVDNQVYYVDSEGVSFKVNVFSDPEIELRDSSLSGGVIKNNQVKISRRILEFAGRLVAEVEGLGHKVEYLALPEDTTRQIAVKLTGRPTEFIFSIDQTVAGQVDAMQQSITYFDQTGQAPVRVDLRVPGRAYYK